MKVRTFENQEDWMSARQGKITGSRLKDIVVKRGTEEKKAFYEIIAERIAEPADDENVMERGHRLEEEAIMLFSKETGKAVDFTLMIWEQEDNKSIAISPDGVISDEEAVEVKCLNSASHIEAILTDTVPSDYQYQVLQYFIVNDELQTLYFVMYDPRMPENLRMKYFIISRESVAEQVAIYHEYQKEKLAKIEEIINQLTF